MYVTNSSVTQKYVLRKVLVKNDNWQNQARARLHQFAFQEFLTSWRESLAN